MRALSPSPSQAYIAVENPLCSLRDISRPGQPSRPATVAYDIPGVSRSNPARFTRQSGPWAGAEARDALRFSLEAVARLPNWLSVPPPTNTPMMKRVLMLIMKKPNAIQAAGFGGAQLKKDRAHRTGARRKT